jgi:hypothetical protein
MGTLRVSIHGSRRAGPGGCDTVSSDHIFSEIVIVYPSTSSNANSFIP